MFVTAGDGAGDTLVVIFTAVKAALRSRFKLNLGFRLAFFGHDIDKPAGTAAAVQRSGAGDHFNVFDIERVDGVELAAVGAR